MNPVPTVVSEIPFLSSSNMALYAGFGLKFSSRGKPAPLPGKNLGIQEYLSVNPHVTNALQLETDKHASK